MLPEVSWGFLLGQDVPTQGQRCRGCISHTFPTPHPQTSPRAGRGGGRRRVRSAPGCLRDRSAPIPRPDPSPSPAGPDPAVLTPKNQGCSRAQPPRLGTPPPLFHLQPAPAALTQASAAQTLRLHFHPPSTYRQTPRDTPTDVPIHMYPTAQGTAVLKSPAANSNPLPCQTPSRLAAKARDKSNNLIKHSKIPVQPPVRLSLFALLKSHFKKKI